MHATINNIKLNLARKWRSNQFDEVIGQDLAVRMLKNSLYLGHYFPVYLFSGQRGCGKTTMARIFAAAVNCIQLPSFQKKPQAITIPCLQCDSCLAMKTSSHPDFIEIDAASHTGVDNVRNIIESSTILPFLGNKKIYLIDEAHMLSKAAFNAFLKILEEPPASVLFILATTDAQKILDTVKSRCFQLFFRPISPQALLPHLQKMCTAENISYDNDGLNLVIKETQGSVRDAINLIEQIRFSAQHISKNNVVQVLGHIDDNHLILLLGHVLDCDTKQLLPLIENNRLHHYSATFIWYRIIELLRALLWVKYGVMVSEFIHNKSIAMLAERCSIMQIHDVLEFWYKHEELFLKTGVQHVFLETLLLKLAYKKNSSEGSSGTPAIASQQTSNSLNDQLQADSDEPDQDNDDESIDDDASPKRQWQTFVKEVDSLEDPLLASIFKQGRFQSFEETTKKIHINFAKELSFFNDWLNESQQLWMPLLKKIFNEPSLILQPLFEITKHIEVTAVAQEHNKPNGTPKAVVHQKQALPGTNKLAQSTTSTIHKKFKSPHQQPSRFNEIKIDVSDGQKWKIANSLLHYFPGVITEIRERVS